MISKYKATTIAKKTCLQNRICHKLVLSKDLTINPPKLKQKAPKKISNGPGILLINFTNIYPLIVLHKLIILKVT